LTTTPKMSRAVDLFVGQAGYGETRCSATVGNNTKFGVWYGMNCAAWCAMSASWAYYMAAFPQPASSPKGFAYTPSGAAWYQGKRAWSPPSANPEKGWVVFFYSVSAGRIAHVGLVRGSRGSDGLIPTVEGNTNGAGSAEGGAVLLKRRSPSQALSFRIAGYGRPDLLPDADTIQPEPAKEWYMVTPIPTENLQQIEGQAVDALQSSEGQEAIKKAVWEVMNDVLTQIGSNQLLVKQAGAPQVYVLLSSRLMHVDSQAKLYAVGGSDATKKIMEYPADDPIWQLPITGQKPTPSA
jgi:hypothetical protein